VELKTPDTDPSLGVNDLPTSIVDGNNYINAGCMAQTGNNFVVSNRGGLPQNPTAILRGRSLWSDLRTASKKGEKISTSSITKSESQIIEATGLIRGQDGELYLVAKNHMGMVVNNQFMNCSG